MKPKIVKPPKHLRVHLQWWCSTERGSFGGGGPTQSNAACRAEAFRIRDEHRALGEDATVYEVKVSYRARRVEKLR